MANRRIIITCSDIEIITGKSHSSAYRELQQVRDALGKKDHEYLTIEEYCNYSGLNEEKVRVEIRAT